MMLVPILLALAIIFAVLATIGQPANPRFAWLPAAILFYFLWIAFGSPSFSHLWGGHY